MPDGSLQVTRKDAIARPLSYGGSCAFASPPSGRMAPIGVGHADDVVAEPLDRPEGLARQRGGAGQIGEQFGSGADGIDFDRTVERSDLDDGGGTWVGRAHFRSSPTSGPLAGRFRGAEWYVISVLAIINFLK